MGIDKAQAMSAVLPARITVMSSRSPITCRTGSWNSRDHPRSNLSTFQNHLAYCTIMGWSRPYWILSDLSISAAAWLVAASAPITCSM